MRLRLGTEKFVLKKVAFSLNFEDWGIRNKKGCSKPQAQSHQALHVNH